MTIENKTVKNMVDTATKTHEEILAGWDALIQKIEDDNLKCSDYDKDVPPPPKKKSYSTKEKPMFGNSDPYTYGL